jgi:hypothetical protein
MLKDLLARIWRGIESIKRKHILVPVLNVSQREEIICKGGTRKQGSELAALRA